MYYSSSVTGPDGYGEAELNRVPKTGGKPSVLLSIPDSGIEALDTLALPTYTEYYIGTAEGLVEEGTTLGGVTDVLQARSVGTTITSISYDADSGDILWGEDDFLQGYDLAVWFSDGTASAVAAGGSPVGIQGDGGAMYYGDGHLESTTL